MEAVRITAALDLPLSIAEAKSHVRFLEDDDDAVIVRLIGAAYEAICHATGRRLAEEVWTWSFNPPANRSCFDLPIAPVTELTGINYVDATGSEQTGNPSEFRLIADTDHPRIEPVATATWPVTDGRADAVKLTFKAGQRRCPDDLRHAIAMMVDHMYHNRSAIMIGQTVAVLPMGVEYFVNQHRRQWIY